MFLSVIVRNLKYIDYMGNSPFFKDLVSREKSIDIIINKHGYVSDRGKM